MGAVAGAVVTPIVASVGNGHAAQMRADSEDDDPAWVDDSVLVVLGVSQLANVHRLLGGYLLLRAVAHKQGLASPLEGHVLAFGDVAQLDLDLGEGQDIGGGAHGGHKLGDHRLGSIDSHYGCGARHQVGEGFTRVAAFLRGLAGVDNLWAPVVREVGYPDVCVGKTDSCST